MKKMNILYVVILGLTLVFPLVSHFGNSRKYMELKGDIHYQERPTLSVDGWLNGEFQTACQKYMEEKIGLRNLFIRIHNQFYFSCFKEPSAQGVIIGKDNYLFEENYINAYYGINFLGNEKIDKQVLKIKAIQEEFKKQQKQLIFIIGPNKASYFSEYIPDKFKKTRRSETNRKRYLEQFGKYGIPCIDYGPWMIEQKHKAAYPLYSKTGIHWTNYAQAFFLDSLSNYLNFYHVPTPKVSFTDVEVTKKLQFYDDDIEQGMNLLFPIANVQHAYPELLFNEKSKKSNALLVGDSYLWNMFERGFFNKMFQNFRYFYYNEDIYSTVPTDVKKTMQFDLKEELKKTDVVIVLCTEANLHRQFFFFVEDLYDAVCCGKERESFSVRLKLKMKQIETDPNWSKSLRERATKEGRSYEILVKEDAAYALMIDRRK